MTKRITLNQLYNTAPDNLSRLPNQFFPGVTHRFLTDEEMIERAKIILKKIELQNPDILLYSDTGVWPLVYICETLIKKTKTKNNFKLLLWRSIKCPRESAGNYESVLLSMLSHKERFDKEKIIRQNSLSLNNLFFDKASMSLRETLIDLKRRSSVHELFGFILKDTEFARLLSGKVLYLDEYINSGITLSNSLNLLKCFNPNIKINILAYHIFARRADLDGGIIDCLYTNDDHAQAFLPGAYPYENRLDIIGKYYVIDNGELRPMVITDILSAHKSIVTDRGKIDQFLDDCLIFIEKNKLINSLATKIVSKDLIESGVVDAKEILRYLLYLFELNRSSKPINSDLLWNLFDMYGPAWSPLPKDYHFDFWNGFESLKNQILCLPDFVHPEKLYWEMRDQIINEILLICAKRHRLWKEKINRMVDNVKL